MQRCIGVSVPETRVCWRQRTTATRWRQLPAGSYHPRPVQRRGRVGICRRRRVCLRQRTTATGWRRQLLKGMLWPASARCHGASGSVCAPNSCLLAPADDLAVCTCTLKPILAATPARSISLSRPATVNGAPLSERKVKAALVPAAPAIHPRAVGRLHRATICRELGHSAQIIKSEHRGTDRRPLQHPRKLIMLAARGRPQFSFLLDRRQRWPGS